MMQLTSTPNPLMDSARQFSSKAKIYDRYRWGYSPAAIEAIFSIARLSPQVSVADIGSGTGSLSQHLVARAKHVFAVEPNAEMRSVADEALSGNASFHSIAGSSEATRLPDRAVELITVGRAIHWFPPESTRSEFLRISEPGGWLAILGVPCLDEPLLSAIAKIKTEANGWDIAAAKAQREKTPLSYYFGHPDFARLKFPATVEETWPTFLGRLASLSSAPNPDHPRYANFENASRKVFDQFKDGNLLRLEIASEVFLGQILDTNCT